MNRIRRALAGLAVVALLAACAPSPQEQARIEELQKNPEISVVGTFDGCEVKFVNRYYRDHSFYLARCADTSTTTRQFTEAQGKSQVGRTRVDITQHVERLQAELRELDAREQALKKLSPEERKALGIQD